MISTKPLKDHASKLQEPLKSIIEMQKDTMSERDFVDFFISLRKRARQIDSENREGIEK